MAMDLQSLIQAAQAAGIGGAPGGASPGMIDPDQNPAMNQATGRMMPPPGVMPPPPGGNPMLMAIQAAMQGGGGSGYMPPVSGGSPTTLSGPAAMMLPNNINSPDGRGMAMGTSGQAGPGSDSDWYAMHEANQGVRGNLPINPTNDYSGYGDEMSPMPDPRQTPKGAIGQKRMGDYNNRASVDQALDDEAATQEAGDRAADFDMRSGQQGIGRYLNRKNTGMRSSGGKVSDEEEIADIQNKMGGVNGPNAKKLNDATGSRTGRGRQLSDDKYDRDELDND